VVSGYARNAEAGEPDTEHLGEGFRYKIVHLCVRPGELAREIHVCCAKSGRHMQQPRTSYSEAGAVVVASRRWRPRHQAQRPPMVSLPGGRSVAPIGASSPLATSLRHQAGVATQARPPRRRTAPGSLAIRVRGPSWWWGSLRAPFPFPIRRHPPKVSSEGPRSYANVEVVPSQGFDRGGDLLRVR
jgi:hypothetical protein